MLILICSNWYQIISFHKRIQLNKLLSTDGRTDETIHCDSIITRSYIMRNR